MLLNEDNKNCFMITDASVVLEDTVLEGVCLVIDNGKIGEISKKEYNIENRVSAKGCYVIPGFIDMHNDCIEKEINPRPDVFFPIDIALIEADKKFSASGITTIFHSLMFGDDVSKHRSIISSDIIAREVDKIKGRLNTNTFVHARYDITNSEALFLIEDLLRNNLIHLMSLNDHTPGQGQYQNIEPLKNYMRQIHKMDEAEVENYISMKKNDIFETVTNSLNCAKLALKFSITLATHDDDSSEKVKTGKKMGAVISEFPVNWEAVGAANSRGMSVVVGAPNILMGKSHSGNLSAMDVIQKGCCGMVCGDYQPWSLLYAFGKLLKLYKFDICAITHLFSTNCADVLNLNTTGKIRTGYDADLIIADFNSRLPVVNKTIAKGKIVYSAN